MKIKELREKKTVDLLASLKSLLKRKFALNLSKANGELKQMHLLVNLKKEIAQIKTIMREKSLSEGSYEQK